MRYKQNTVLYSAMSGCQACLQLTGLNNAETAVVKSFDELNQIGVTTNNKGLLYQNFLNQMVSFFWMREYRSVAELSEKHKRSGQKRISETCRIFMEGISSLILARGTHEPSHRAKWKSIGETSVEEMLKMEKINAWNYEDVRKLLQAELHHLNGDLKSAEVEYKAAIASSQSHNFLHNEVLGYELYGMFCVENQDAEKGIAKLRTAIDKCKQWGAMNKAKKLELYVDNLKPSHPKKKHKPNV